MTQRLVDIYLHCHLYGRCNTYVDKEEEEDDDKKEEVMVEEEEEESVCDEGHLISLMRLGEAGFRHNLSSVDSTSVWVNQLITVSKSSLENRTSEHRMQPINTPDKPRMIHTTDVQQAQLSSTHYDEIWN